MTPWSDLLTNFYWLVFIFLGWYFAGLAHRKLEYSKRELERNEKFWKDRRLDSPDEKFREQEERNAKQLRSAIKTFSSRRTRILLGVLAYGLILFGVAAAIKTYVDKVGVADSTINTIVVCGVGSALLQMVCGEYLRREDRRKNELEILKRKLDAAMFHYRLEKSQSLESSASALHKEYVEKSGEMGQMDKLDLDWINWIKAMSIFFSFVFCGVFFVVGIIAIFSIIPTEQRFQFAIVLSAVFWFWIWRREMNVLKRASQKAELDIKQVRDLLYVVSDYLAKSQNIETKIKTDNP
jgi:hypothetical protein